MLVIISVQLPEFKRCDPGCLLKHCDEMTGIGKPGPAGDLLDLHMLVGDQEFPGPVDPVDGQVFVDRAAKEPPEQPGQILRRDIHLPA